MRFLGAEVPPERPRDSFGLPEEQSAASLSHLAPVAVSSRTLLSERAQLMCSLLLPWLGSFPIRLGGAAPGRELPGTKPRSALHLARQWLRDPVPRGQTWRPLG